MQNVFGQLVHILNIPVPIRYGDGSNKSGRGGWANIRPEELRLDPDPIYVDSNSVNYHSSLSSVHSTLPPPTITPQLHYQQQHPHHKHHHRHYQNQNQSHHALIGEQINLIYNHHHRHHQHQNQSHH